MKIIEDPISLEELRDVAKKLFGNMIKVVVDIEKEQMAIDGELHADEEALLLQNGSKQQNLWGINLYPDMKGKDFIEFDSMINLRPSIRNNSRSIDNPQIREKITQIVKKLIKP
ncbi:hypothetical protein HY029_05095 [Candidatus Gottesmanbacteria bacterium]|nr:hypothetical protein [Candidatus Gottesmanbacteria bacterium]